MPRIEVFAMVEGERQYVGSVSRVDQIAILLEIAERVEREAEEKK